ncbi:NBS-LRR resistance protein RAS5-1 [Artemisia annua]|uniref:NBS-LRR resistance protein RAS5-1 n=1 Tax=Artemisia annua TaxID=35608 RepID=A0A2U1LT19_ARTAN|nr:NBS-LRR resistance protein RAS5-1 [Artemisia annua]
MASSSSSHPTPASSSQSWIYDVFLSFRGEDTRKTFVDHLYSSLEQQGIYTYKDDETLPRGDLIDSSWCLDELAYIMECMGTRGQTVMPIFYDVDPYVRKQKGKYGEAFAKYESANNNKVESWRKALVAAGNLSGWVPKDFANGHEAKCIKDIIGSISSRRGAMLIVGIWGVGGGGKTTLAYSAYTKFSIFFEGHCFLENIRDESNKQGMQRLQEKTLSRTTKTQVVIENDNDGRSMIKRRLCHKTVLVVLDDVNDLKQLESLAGSHDWFGDGSRILITTRDENLLTRKADVIYGVSLLSHDEGIKLFNRHAYREDKPVQDYHMMRVSSYSIDMHIGKMNLYKIMRFSH